MPEGALLVGVTARVLTSAVQAGLDRQHREPTAPPRSGAGRVEEPEAGP